MRLRFAALTLILPLITGLVIGCRPVRALPTAAPPSARSTSPVPPAAAPTSAHDRIAASIDIGSPYNMNAGDGFLWVISGDSIVKIDPQTNQIFGEPLRIGIQAEDIAVGDGQLWVSRVAQGDLGAPSDTDAVARIDPQSGEVLATISVARGPMSMAYTSQAIWVVNFGQSGDSVIRIDPRTNEILGEPVQTGGAPLSLAVGGGSLWVANHDVQTITRIDLATNQVVANIAVPSEPHRVAYGEGAVWVSNWHVNSVTRIDPATNQVVGEPIPIGFPAGNIAAGLGSVWVTSDYRAPVDAAPEDVVLVRIDPQTNRAVETIPLGGHPIDVEIAGEAVWVSILAPNMILRINP
jgi:YVTN family beta-propeller protein